MKNANSPVLNPFPPVSDGHSKVLILGSLPSEASRAAGFYYMHPHNRFWKVMSALFGESFPTMSAEEKAAALLSHGIALSDVVQTCEIHRSSDASIKEVVPTAVPDLLAHSEIEKILLNGKTAYRLFLKHFPSLADRAILLPSTSPANAAVSLEELIKRWGDALRE